MDDADHVRGTGEILESRQGLKTLPYTRVGRGLPPSLKLRWTTEALAEVVRPRLNQNTGDHSVVEASSALKVESRAPHTR